jgi:hypothetical protein
MVYAGAMGRERNLIHSSYFSVPQEQDTALMDIGIKKAFQ